MRMGRVCAAVAFVGGVTWIVDWWTCPLHADRVVALALASLNFAIAALFARTWDHS
jgi:hypothetical protein